MENLLKKFFYTGVGLVSITAERLQKTVDEMVGEGKVSEEEGKKIVDGFVEDIDKRRSEFESNMKETIDNFASKVNTPDFMKNNVFTEINERLEKIEDHLGIQHETKENTPIQNAVNEAAEEAKEATENVSKAVGEQIDKVEDAVEKDMNK